MMNKFLSALLVTLGLFFISSPTLAQAPVISENYCPTGSTPAWAPCSASNPLQVTVASGSGGGTQYTQGTAGTNITTNTGNLLLGNVNSVDPTFTYYTTGTMQPVTLDPDGNLHVEQPDWSGSGSVSTASVATSSSSGTTITTAAGTWAVDQTIALTGTLGTTLSAGQIYYIVATNGTTTMQISATKGGAAITPSLSLTSAAVWNAYVITLGDGQSTMSVQLSYSGGSGTINPVVAALNNWTPSNFVAPSSGTLAVTASAAGTFKMAVSGWKYVGFFVNANSSANTVTINWHSSANSSTVALSSPLPNGGNTIGNVGATVADGADAAEGATTATAATVGSTGSVNAKLRLMTTQLDAIQTAVSGAIPAGAVTTIIGGTVNGANTYNTVAASQTNQVLTGGGGGATGDYLSHCTIVPATTAPGVVTILDNAVSVYAFPGGGTTALTTLIPFTIPIGAVSVSGAWKVTTGANVSVACVGKFH